MRSTLLAFMDRQMPLILLCIMHGVTRFDALHRQTGVARNILSSRLNRLVEDDVLERRPIGAGGGWLEYRLTGGAMRS